MIAFEPNRLSRRAALLWFGSVQTEPLPIATCEAYNLALTLIIGFWLQACVALRKIGILYNNLTSQRR